MVAREPGRAQVEPGGHLLQAARLRRGVPAARGDPVAERQHAHEEFRGAEVAVPDAGDVRLPQQVAVAGRGDQVRVVVLLLDGDELVGDRVQVQRARS